QERQVAGADPATPGRHRLRACEWTTLRSVRETKYDALRTASASCSRPEQPPEYQTYPVNSPKRGTGSMTAAELLALQEQIRQTAPEYRMKEENLEADQPARAQVLSEAEQPIVEDLRRAALRVDSVWDLVNTAEPYPRALPILLNHLERGGYPDKVME